MGETTISEAEYEFLRSVGKMARQGSTVREMATVLGVAHATLYSRVRRRGLTFTHNRASDLCCVRTGASVEALVEDGILVVEKGGNDGPTASGGGT